MREHVAAAYWAGGCFGLEYGPLVFLLGAAPCLVAVVLAARTMRRVLWAPTWLGVSTVVIGVAGALAWGIAFLLLDGLSHCEA